MRLLGLATVAACITCSVVPVSANTTNSLGTDPNVSIKSADTSGCCNGSFANDWTFHLDNTTSLSVTSVTNTYASVGGQGYINSFALELFSGTPTTGTGIAAGVLSTSANSQQVDLTKTLAAGNYYLEFTGSGDSLANYGGTVSTFAVPGPIVGAGLPGLVAACGGLLALGRRRRQKVA